MSVVDEGDRQARAVLSLLHECQLPEIPYPEAEDPLTCPNCGVEMEGERSPYCSDRCKAQAAFVRQFRRALQDGAILKEEKQAMMGQNLWYLLGGGYPGRQKLAPKSAIKQLFKRTEGLCESCAAPATTFDHTGSG